MASIIRTGAGKRRDALPAAIAGVALGLVVLAGSAPIVGLRTYLVMVIIAGLGLVVIARRLQLGVAILPLVAAAVPFTVGTGTSSPIVAALIFSVVLLALWIVRAVVAHDFAVVRSPIYLPVLTLMVVWIVAFGWGDIVHSPLVWTWTDFILPRIGQLGVVLISSGVLLLGLNASRDLRCMKIATWGLLALSVIPLIAFWTGTSNAVSFISTGGLFTNWVVALAYGQALFNRKLPTWFRIGLVIFVVAWLVKATLFDTIWFSGWLPSLTAFAVITLLRSRKVFVVLIIAAAIGVATHQATVEYALYQQKVDAGDITRVGIWAQALTQFYENPILGTGPAGYAAYNMSIFRGSQYSLSTHSNYLDVVIETGFVGTVVFGWFLITMLYLGWRAVSRWPSGFEGGLAHGSLGAYVGVLAAMGLGDWFIPFVYNQTIAGYRYTVYSWLFLGFLANLAARHPTIEG